MDRSEELISLWEHLESVKRDMVEIRRQLNRTLNQMTPEEIHRATDLYRAKTA